MPESARFIQPKMKKVLPENPLEFVPMSQPQTQLSLDRTPKLVTLCGEIGDFHEFEVVLLQIQGAHSIGVEGHKVDHTILHEGIGKP